MLIIKKMSIISLAVTASIGFWASAVALGSSLVPRTEGTLLDCKFNQKMDQPICKPFTMKASTKNRSQ